MTLYSLFKNATYPKRLFVGLVQQRDPKEDSDCVEEFCKMWEGECPSEQIRVMEKFYKEAKGPCIARYLASTLYDNEDYFLQIDAHSRFGFDWDEVVLWHIGQLPQKSIIAHHPPSPRFQQKSFIYTCRYDIGGYHIPRPAGYTLSVKMLKQYPNGRRVPLPAPFLGAGLIFVPRSFLKEVPWDPHLDYMFEGEELILSARAFTHGYNIYGTSENVIFHHYRQELGIQNSKTDKTWFYNHVSGSAKDAIDRLFVMFKKKKPSEVSEKALKELDRYGMGKVRTIEEFQKYVGIPEKWSKDGTQTVDWCNFKNSLRYHITNKT